MQRPPAAPAPVLPQVPPVWSGLLHPDAVPAGNRIPRREPLRTAGERWAPQRRRFRIPVASHGLQAANRRCRNLPRASREAALIAAPKSTPGARPPARLR
jgi:hypothetical protein